MSSQRIVGRAILHPVGFQPARPAGKRVSSLDRLLYSGRPSRNARTVVLPNENADEYIPPSSSHIQDLHPTGPVEMDLITNIVNAKWRQRRLYNIETGLFEQQMDKQKEKIEAACESCPESVENSFVFRTLSESGCLAMLSHLESRLERTYSRSLSDLRPLRSTGNKDGGKRTESQERTPSVNPNPPAQQEQIRTCVLAGASGAGQGYRFRALPRAFFAAI